MAKQMRTSWIGFDSRLGQLLAGDSSRRTGNVHPDETIVITVRPQVAAWRGERLFVHQPIASSFVIHGLRIGARETTAASGAIPADAFATRMDRLAEIDEMFRREGTWELKIDKVASEILGASWILPTCFCAQDVSLIVENIGDRPLRFLAGMLGTEAD
jgi:hypothetical protein